MNVPLSSLEKQKMSATVLANAGVVVSSIIKQIAGNDISNSINGSTISNEIIQTLAYQRIGKQLTKSVA
jgi:hypothetical protein